MGRLPRARRARPTIGAAAVAGLAVIAAWKPVGSTARGQDPFAFLPPPVSLSDSERQRLDRRDVIIRILPAHGHEIAVLAAGALAVGPDAFLASVSDIAALKKSTLVPQIARFSDPPRLSDLQSLTLDDGDVDAIKECRPDDCDLKLRPDEIERLRRAASSGESRQVRSAIEGEFRRVLLDRATGYLQRGDVPAELAALIDHSAYLQTDPELARYLRQFPQVRLPGAESFLYWSKETYAWKPMIMITHVTMLRRPEAPGMPVAVIAARDIFSSRYTSASLALTLLAHTADDPPRHYLVYINRTWADALHWLWRPFVEHRIKGESKKVFQEALGRIERHGVNR